MLNKDDLIECTRCKKRMFYEEYADHVCTAVLNYVREIKVDYWWLSKTDKNLIIAKGLDGVLYRLVKNKRRGFRSLSNENLQEEGSNGKWTEPD